MQHNYANDKFIRMNYAKICKIMHKFFFLGIWQTGKNFCIVNYVMQTRGGGNLTCLWYGVVPFFRVPFS